MSNVKNYHEQGGEKWVVGGQLEIATGGKLTFQGTKLKPAAGQADSEATTIAALKEDFNTLLGKLYAAGLMVADTTALVAAIISAIELLEGAVVGTEPGEYPQAAYDTFSAAIDAAQDIADEIGVSQSEVNTAVTTLNTAVSTFEAAKILVDKSGLIAAIASAQDLLAAAEAGTEPGQYPQEAITTFETAIGAAQAVVDDAEATQNDVDDAVTTLAAAVAAFEAAVITE